MVLEGSNRLQGLWRPDVSVRDAREPGNEAGREVRGPFCGLQPGRLRDFKPHDSRPWTGRGAWRGQAEVAGIPILSQPEESCALACAMLRNPGVELQGQERAEVCLDVADHREVTTPEEVERAIDQDKVVLLTKCLSEAAFLLPHPGLQLPQGGIWRRICDRNALP